MACVSTFTHFCSLGPTAASPLKKPQGDKRLRTGHRSAPVLVLGAANAPPSPADPFRSYSPKFQPQPRLHVSHRLKLAATSAKNEGNQGKRPATASPSPAPVTGEDLEVDVAIIGGGPCGASAALAIHRVAPELSVAVFERATKLRNIGGLIGIFGNGMSALEAIGEELRAAVERNQLKEGPVKVMDFDSNVTTVPSFLTVTFVPWATLQRTLHEFLPPGSLHLHHTLQHLEQDDEWVHLRFAEGPRVRARVVIGADGNRSHTRSLILGDGPPQLLPGVLWRGMAPISESLRAHMDFKMLVCREPSSISAVILIRITDDEVCVVASAGVEEEELSEIEGGREMEEAARGEVRKQRALAKFQSFPPLLRELLASLQPSTITEHVICVRSAEQCQDWVRGRVALAGDAAHLMSAFTGQGANQSLLDAVELGRTIGEWGLGQPALEAYAAARVEEATRVQEASVRLAMTTYYDKVMGNEGAWFQNNMDLATRKCAPLQPTLKPLA